MKIVRFILWFRPIRYIFYRNWYSTMRWRKPYDSPYGEIVYLLDFGFITFGFATNKKLKE